MTSRTPSNRGDWRLGDEGHIGKSRKLRTAGVTDGRQVNEVIGHRRHL